ncbi:hypothetical protein [Pseudomonas sp. HY7a-MNA-CIBAN-0227]|uniref:hypothetical protein n=1 Tax=Pseudomonas sp. HY7a-MNA-CIBAN-0227 TaxID=3140474 RepID=UPI0033220EE2
MARFTLSSRVLLAALITACLAQSEFDSQPLRQLEQCLREGIQLEPTVAAHIDTPALAAPGHSTPSSPIRCATISPKARQ